MDAQDVFAAVLEVVPDINRRYLALSIANILWQFQLGDVNQLTSLDEFVPEEADADYEVKFSLPDPDIVAVISQTVIEQLIENGYPRHNPAPRQNVIQLNPPPEPEDDLLGPSSPKRPNLGLDGYFMSKEQTSHRVSSEYIDQAIQLLTNEFRWFYLSAITYAFKLKEKKYLDTRNFLISLIMPFFDCEMNVASIDPLQPQYPRRLDAAILENRFLQFEDYEFQLLKNVRKVLPQPVAVSHPDLLSELESLRHKSPEPGNPAYMPVECACCFCETTAETLLACQEGHIYCNDCMVSYIKTKTQDGVNKGFLECMESDCQAQFSHAVLIARLPNDLIEKLDERIAASNLHQAGLNDLVRCPKCSAVYELDQDQNVLRCIGCSFASCRRCGKEWNKEYEGKKCEDLESTDETKKRQILEEKMSAELIRPCPKCKTPLLKNEGCNKLTCSCGATMCYVCRTPFIKYDHFCQHPRDPGKGCDKCTNCSLWIDPSAQDEARIKELEAEAKRLQDEERQARLAKLDAPSTSSGSRFSEKPSTSKGPFLEKASTNSSQPFFKQPSPIKLPSTFALPGGSEPVNPLKRLFSPSLRPVGTTSTAPAQPLARPSFFFEKAMDPFKALCQAVDKNDLLTIRQLVDRHGPGLLQGKYRWPLHETVVHRAAGNGNVPTLALLLDLGAPVSPRDSKNNAPIHRAIALRKSETAILLLQRGEDVNAVGEFRRTPLILAALLNLVDLFSELVNRRGNFEAVDSNGWRAIHYAARNGNCEIINILCDKRAKISARTGGPGDTALIIAIVSKHCYTAQLLVQRGADVHIRDCTDRTPLHLAIEQGDNFHDTSQIILQHGGNFFARSKIGATPCDLAARYDLTLWRTWCQTRHN